MDDKDGIPEYFRGKNIFVTGGFGFLGQVLIEKLLRSFHDVGKLYVLIRPKKGKSVQERLDKIKSGVAFKQIMETKPEVFVEKLVLLEGDITRDKLGLSDHDYETLTQRINIVIHLAASIKFDDPLAFALQVNVMGTKRVLDFATETRNLEVFVHVSSTYAHCNLPEVKDVHYNPKIKWDKMIDIMEKTDSATFELLSAKIIDEFPNTYVFSKQLAEDLVWDYRKVLPMSIVRPSIVVSCYKEPVPGWTDSLMGPAGFMIGAVKGVIRVIYTDKEAYAGFIPADISTKATIAAAWYRHKYRDLDDEEYIYNVNYQQKKTNRAIMQDAHDYLTEYPLRYPLWNINVYMTKSFTMYLILYYISHLIPALLIDSLLTISGRKPKLFKLQKKYYKAMDLLSSFVLRNWKFDIDNLLRLDEAIPIKDRKEFGPNILSLDEDKYMKLGFLFGRKHFLKDPPGERYEFWFRNKVLLVLDWIVRGGVVALIGWIALRICSAIGLTQLSFYYNF